MTTPKETKYKQRNVHKYYSKIIVSVWLAEVKFTNLKHFGTYPSFSHNAMEGGGRPRGLQICSIPKSRFKNFRHIIQLTCNFLSTWAREDKRWEFFLDKYIRPRIIAQFLIFDFCHFSDTVYRNWSKYGSNHKANLDYHVLVGYGISCQGPQSA